MRLDRSGSMNVFVDVTGRATTPPANTALDSPERNAADGG
jgi:hypothetical protein